MFIPLLLAATLSTNLRAVERAYVRDDASRLVPLLSEVLRFPTVAGDEEARLAPITPMPVPSKAV